MEDPLRKLWFTRAGTHSLSLYANCISDGVPSWLLQALSVYAPRCHDIEIAMHHRPYHGFIWLFPALQLHKIRLELPPAPGLKTLRLVGRFMPKSFNEIGPAGLTDLEIGGWLSFPACTPIFTDFPHLRRLSLPFLNVRTLPPSLPPMQELECLRLGCGVELLHLLQVPKLRSLTISTDGEQSAELLSAFLLTLPGQITELELSIWINVPNVTVYACLDALPDLVTLKLRFHDPTRLFYALPPLLNLRTLIISNIDGPPGLYQAVLAMLSSINLLRLEFYVYPDIDEDVSVEGLDSATLATLSAYAQQGCIVWVTTPTQTWPEDRDDADSVDYAEYKAERLRLCR
ncbi:hypothetical protein K438DRAFT_1971804 [Mycena galopus ATCC 62051]|nr:hypothetical protein K438DRAFT_1971804 [Mycena galopus ATCC 62051]